ncbi:MAG: DUF1343 domain-containing protein [Polyangiaceae bacterium]|jgi:uncharacterized protein YbbC (DUF1343 family)|nr:DUF1343 domain-containing protein [Polyangiaceae bacterium]
MRTGLDRLPSLPSVLRSLQAQRVGLLAHAPSVNRDLLHANLVLAAAGVRPRRIFGPEHGFGGEAQDMIGVPHATDPISRAPIVSLYGDQPTALSPSAEHLDDLDVLLIDLCDVGSRYYTFVWTALLAVRAAARCRVRCILLDRPNPIGGDPAHAEGRPQRPGFLSFVGLEPIPVRHALTAGELVTEMVVRDGLSVGPDEALDVIAVQGWDRSSYADAWDRPFVLPSPNMPTLDTALVYPGGCLIEGTNLSEGRGLTRPFETFGAPWLDGFRLARDLAALRLRGFVPRPVTFQPTFHKHAQRLCGGVQIHVTERSTFRPVATYVAMLALAHHQNPEAFRFRTERYEFIDHIPAIDLLTGASDVRNAIEHHAAPADVMQLACPVDPGYADLHAHAVARVQSMDRGRA